MIVGAAVLPTAPLLVPGVSATLPPGVAKVADAVDAVVEALPPCDVVVLVTDGPPAVHATGAVSLEGIGRPDIATEVEVHEGAVARVAEITGYEVDVPEHLPLGLAVLALHLGDPPPIVALTVPADASFDDLTDIGRALAQELTDAAERAAIVVAGDLSAGLTEKSPLHLVDGAIFFDEQAVAAVDSGRLAALGRLGPGEARRVGARAWAPLAVLHGVSDAAKLGMVVRHYSAPRGVGYLVASGS